MIGRCLFPLALAGICLLTGCSTFTGLPSHGGGKRFFVEQELISASARAAAMSLDLTQLQGRKASVLVIAMGDEGGGNLVGGRYEWQAALRGAYMANPVTRSINQFPLQDSLTVTRDGAGAILSQIETNSPINFPSQTESQSEGGQADLGGGVGYNGVPTYQATGFINPNDTVFLNAIIREACFLKGVILTTPDQAEFTIYVTVDIFGTHRSRTEMHIYNQERLSAKTAMEVTVIDRKGKIFVPPQTASWEADYREHYVLWCGPIEMEKRVFMSDDLLVSYRGLCGYEISAELLKPQAQAEEGNSPGVAKVYEIPPAPLPEITRPNQLTQPRPAPQPNRPEDVLPALR